MQFIKAGKILNVHGLKGLVKIECFLENKFDIFLHDCLIEGVKRRLTHKFLKKKFLVVKIDKIETIEEVSFLKNKYIYIEHVENLEENQYFYETLKKMKAYDETKKLLGGVSAIHNFGAGDILEINGKMLPFKFVKINEKEKRIDCCLKLI